MVQIVLDYILLNNSSKIPGRIKDIQKFQKSNLKE